MGLFSNPLVLNVNFYWHHWEDYKCQSRQITAWLHPHYYRIVTGKWPWALATKAPGYEDWRLHRGGAWILQLMIPVQMPTPTVKLVETRLQVGPVCSTIQLSPPSGLPQQSICVHDLSAYLRTMQEFSMVGGYMEDLAQKPQNFGGWRLCGDGHFPGDNTVSS